MGRGVEIVEEEAAIWKVSPSRKLHFCSPPESIRPTKAQRPPYSHKHP